MRHFGRRIRRRFGDNATSYNMRLAGGKFVMNGALVAPFEWLQLIMLGLCAGMVALVTIHGAALTLAYRREAGADSRRST